MLPLDLARSLQAAGVRWLPAPGDAFVVPDRDLDEHVFVLSDMVVQTLEVPGGAPILAFNGTTEWALDSLEAAEAIWLPREDQLRALLGGAFTSLERVAGDPGGYAVTVTVGAGSGGAGSGGGVGGTPTRHVDVTADAAYARALLSLVE